MKFEFRRECASAVGAAIRRHKVADVQKGAGCVIQIVLIRRAVDKTDGYRRRRLQRKFVDLIGRPGVVAEPYIRDGYNIAVLQRPSQERVIGGFIAQWLAVEKSGAN